MVKPSLSPPAPAASPPPSTPPRRNQRRLPTHSLHTPRSSLSHLALVDAAPVKEDDHQLPAEDEADPQKSPSVEASSKKAIRTRSVFAAAVNDIVSPRNQSPLAALPVESSCSNAVEEDTANPNRRASDSSVDLIEFFGEKLQHPPAPRESYVVPHRRPDDQRRRHAAPYDTSALPHSEDHFYTNPAAFVSPLTLNPSIHSPVQSRSAPRGGIARNESSSSRRSLPNLQFVPPRPALVALHQPATSRRLQELEPPCSPPSTLICRKPYDDPLHFHHPASIVEEIISDADGSEYDCASTHAPSLATQAIAEDNTPTEANFSASIHQGFFASTVVSTAGSIDNDSSDSEYVDAENSDGNNEDSSVCTSCGALPVRSFVALVPCDHLVCNSCLNTLINSAAHKPPRPLDCFFCGKGVRSFEAAWEGVEGNMVESLQDCLAEEKRLGLEEAAKRHQEKGKDRSPASEDDSSDDEGPARFFPESSPSSPHNDSDLDPRYNHSTPRSYPLGRQISFAREPSAEQEVDSGYAVHGDSQTSADMSPLRKLVWSAEPPDEDGVRGISSVLSKAPVLAPPLLEREFIPQPFDWPLLRIDNIPWDVTVEEIEDWLPVDTLAPEKNCVLAVHILCNRTDGRTLNQCYIEAASLPTARAIVRSRNGKKLRGRPVHITLCGAADFMTTIFPSWPTGDVESSTASTPLIMQSELTGLLSLCKLESAHASKVHERPYFNIVTLLQKFPWHRQNLYNSKQIVRLYHTALAAVEILVALRDHIDNWSSIMDVVVEAVTACPAFRASQKAKVIAASRAHGSSHSSPPSSNSPAQLGGAFNFSPPSLQETYVTVRPTLLIADPPTDFEYSNPLPRPSKRSPVAPGGITEDLDIPSDFVHPGYADVMNIPDPSVRHINVLPSTQPYRPTPPRYSTPSDAESTDEEADGRTAPINRRRRVESVSKLYGLDESVVRAIAAHLGVEQAGEWDNSAASIASS